jgi:hypothetical protein
MLLASRRAGRANCVACAPRKPQLEPDQLQQTEADEQAQQAFPLRSLRRRIQATGRKKQQRPNGHETRQRTVDGRKVAEAGDGQEAGSVAGTSHTSIDAAANQSQ